MEQTFDQHLENLLAVFREVRRVLRPEGTLYLNYGDAYWSNPGNGRGGGRWYNGNDPHLSTGEKGGENNNGWKPKDLMLMPTRVAESLQAEGWWLRSMMPLIKTNPMPESVKDRPTSAVEYFFMFAKSKRYYWDHVAVKTPIKGDLMSSRKARQNPDAKHQATAKVRGINPDKQRGHSRRHAGFNERWDLMSKEEQQANGAAMRNYIIGSTRPFPDAHFATYNPDWIVPFVRAGCPKRGIILDPFAGAGTTGLVASREERHSILIEINDGYAEMAAKRIRKDNLPFNQVSVV